MAMERLRKHLYTHRDIWPAIDVRDQFPAKYATVRTIRN